MLDEIRAKVEAAEIHRDPFPHVVVEDLLPEPFFRELAATIPPIEYFKQAKNGRKADLPIIATNKAFVETPEEFRATWGRLRDDVLHDAVAPCWPSGSATTCARSSPTSSAPRSRTR